MKEISVVTTTEFIATKILFRKGERVLLDADLAQLYGVETRALKQAVRRNIERFPNDFLFELSKEEWDSLRSQIVTLETGRVNTQSIHLLPLPNKGWPCSAASSTVSGL